jgi:DNA polymerase III delta subunit
MRPTEFITTLRKGKARPAYFLRGPDRFVHEECRKALVNSIPADARQWCLVEIEFQPGQLQRELEGADQMPMLGGHSFYFFSDPEDFKAASDEDHEALEDYLRRPSPFATVVFAACEPDRRRRFIQLLEKKAEVVEMLPLDRREASRWVIDFLDQAGVEIAAELAEDIAGKFEISHDWRAEAKRGGVNLLWLRTELEKLLTAKPGLKRLEPADLELIVAFREEREIGKLLRALAERKFGEAVEFLRALLGSKVAETLLLWCIGDLFRQALRSPLSSTFDRGPARYGAGRDFRHPGPAGTSAGAGGWSRAANPYSTSEIARVAVRNYPREELLQALRAVRRADLGIKSSWKDSRILLEFLVWQIVAGKASTSESPLGEEVPAPSAEG